MLTLHQSNRLEHLARRLAELLSRPVDDPLRAEWVVVQHPGMGRWLSLELAASMGIAANLAFPLPAVFVWEAFRQLLPQVPELDRYQPNRLAWRLHGLLSSVAFGHPSPLLSSYLERGDERRRFQLAEQLATLYDRYLLYRPDWILAWERGESATEGDAWQAELWRRLAAQEPYHWVGLQQAFFASPMHPPTGGLPSRISLFGVPTLSPGYLQTLQRLAERIDVHLFLLNPCAAHWAEIVAPQEQLRRELDNTAEALYLEVGHPLLATLGRQGRDFFAAVNEFDPGSEELFEPAPSQTLLARLQNQILDLEEPAPGASADDSISVHLCHSPMREVEVLYDQLLAMFETLPDLSPNEVLVMAPEIDRYAPLVEAVFGEPGDRPALPYRLSDRALMQRNPLAAALLALLDLPGSRYTLGQMLSLLEQPAVQRRFGLDESSLEPVTRWLVAAGVRWGRDGESKQAWGLPPDEGNTWRQGLRRLLLGYAMPRDGEALWRGLLPLDAAEGGGAELLGGMLDFCHRLFGLESQLARPRPVAEWRETLLGLVQGFFLADATDQDPLEELRGILQRLGDEAGEAGFDGEVSLPLIRYRLQTLLEGADGRGFLGGGVTFCALAPMRSLPFRVICLLGMDDGVFPRAQPRFGFDLMADRFRFGDRSRRVDDRYLFLETLISARERLYLSYVGHSQRDNTALPPAVVVDELCDTLRRMVGDEGLAQLIHRHPLQPFSPAYFTGDGGLLCYSGQRREAAMRVGRGLRRESALAPTPLETRGETPMTEVPLERLCDFFANPPRLFARERLQLSLEAVAELPEEREPFTLDTFERLDDERAMVEALLLGGDPDELRARLEATGRLPHGSAGRLELEAMLQRAASMAQRLDSRLAGGTRFSRDIDLSLAEGRISGRLHDLTDAGRLVYDLSAFYPYQLLRHWIEHLVMNLTGSSRCGGETRLLELDREGRFLPPEDAAGLLESLLSLYRAGQDRPLPFYPGTAWSYLDGLDRHDEERAMREARKRWSGNAFQEGDGAKPYNALLWPDFNVFNDEFGSLAERILDPLRRHLEWS